MKLQNLTILFLWSITSFAQTKNISPSVHAKWSDVTLNKNENIIDALNSEDNNIYAVSGIFKLEFSGELVTPSIVKLDDNCSVLEKKDLVTDAEKNTYYLNTIPTNKNYILLTSVADKKSKKDKI